MHSLRPSRFRTSIAANFGKAPIQRQGMLFALLHTQADPSVPTFQYQKSLPRLPLPPLRQTLDKYLRSLEPFFLLQQQNGVDSITDARAKREAWARSFETGIGARCQQRLQELVEVSPYNWLDDNFWLRKAYLESRGSLLVDSNWWLALQDDPIVPSSTRLSSQPQSFNVWQLRRAAWVIKRMLEFKTRLDAEKLPPDLIRAAPLCMSHYKRMFNMTRIPQTQCDTLRRAPISDPAARQIAVMIQNHVFLVDVYRENDSFIGLDSIVQRLDACARAVTVAEAAVPVSILTADDRETWAKNRIHLSNLSADNQAALSSIDSSLFCISLDTTTNDIHNSFNNIDMDGLTNPRWDDHLHNTAYGQKGYNRWFDKTISMSIESNTRLGMMGEHSPCDALIPSILGDYCVEEPMRLEDFGQDGAKGTTGRGGSSGWKQIEWVTDEYIRSECQRVGEQAQSLIVDSDDSQLWFEDYGVDWIRGTAKLSPDAYIQMALQLAWYKDQGRFTAVYETASTRIFLHGRTEVIRSFSRESLLFIQAMNRGNATQGDRLRLLQSAIKAHNTYTRDASSGQGIDRHLMALRLVMEPGEATELFTDELFSQSQEWKLSTSGLSSGDRFIGTGFGSPYPDGYGINYLAGANILKFGIESKHSCLTTSTQAFKKALVQSLRELRATCEEGYFELLPPSTGEEQVQARL